METLITKREKMIIKLSNFLKSMSYDVYNFFTPIFDLFAIGRYKILLKFFENLDSLTYEQAEDMKKLSLFLDASSIIVAEKTSRCKLYDNIVYFRFSIPSLTFHTFKKIIKNNGYFHAFAKKGKLMSFINTQKLREVRKRKNFSLKMLAEKVSITKKCLYEIENRLTHPTLKTLKKLESVLGEDLKEWHNILEKREIKVRVNVQSNIEKRIIEKFNSLEMWSINFNKIMFEIGAKNENTRIATYLLLKEKEKRLEKIENEGEKIRKFVTPLVITSKRISTSLPSISLKDFMKIPSRRSLEKILF